MRIQIKRKLLNLCTMMITATSALCFLQACSLQLISEYDKKSLDQTEKIAEKVDYFFARLSYTPVMDRNYIDFAQSYLDIEVDLNSLNMRQKSRPLNELTTKQVDIVTKLWKESREQHKRKNTMSDFLIARHRRQFNQMFLAIIKGEESKPHQQP